jgi:hypothetical protein
MQVLVKITIVCPKHPRPDPKGCTNCRLVEQLSQDWATVQARRESVLARIREAAKAKAVVLSEIG